MDVINLQQRQRQRFGIDGIRLPPDRRKWMVVIVVAAVTMTLVLGVLARLGPDSDLEQPGGALDLETTRRLAAMGFRPTGHHIDRLRVFAASENFELKAGLGLVRGRPLRTDEEAAVAGIVERELARYPKGLLAAAGVWRILLAAELEEEGRAIPSLPNVDHGMLLDGTIDPSFLPRLIHHEIYHFIDLADDGSIIADRQWELLNAPGATYGFGGREIRDPLASAIRDDLPGFVSRFATASVQEDKAELFSVAMTRPETLVTLRASDPYLTGKLKQLQRRLGEFSPQGDQTLPPPLR